MPPHGREPVPPFPALAGTVASGQSPIPLGNAPIPSCTPPPMASREAGPPSGGHRRPLDGSESLRNILTIPPYGRRANSTVPPPLAGTVMSGQSPIPSCTPPPMASREAGPPSRGHRRPPDSSERLRKILTMPPHGRQASSTVPQPPVRGHRANFTKALRAAGGLRKVARPL